jgi:hypothetical protein
MIDGRHRAKRPSWSELAAHAISGSIWQAGHQQLAEQATRRDPTGERLLLESIKDLRPHPCPERHQLVTRGCSLHGSIFQ